MLCSIEEYLLSVLRDANLLMLGGSTLPSWIPIFERYMARVVLKNTQQKHMCYNEIGVCAQEIDTIPGSIPNRIRTAYVITRALH